MTSTEEATVTAEEAALTTEIVDEKKTSGKKPSGGDEKPPSYFVMLEDRIDADGDTRSPDEKPGTVVRSTTTYTTPLSPLLETSLSEAKESKPAPKRVKDGKVTLL